MIVLDTNVISEAMKPAPNPAVQAWLNEQVAETLYLTSVTLSEMLFGIAMLPVGRRRNTLTRALDGLLELFGDRVLPFDTDAARHYAALAVAARNDWEMDVFDFHSAFLNGKLDRDKIIYMDVPPGLEVNKKFKSPVALLHVALWDTLYS